MLPAPPPPDTPAQELQLRLASIQREMEADKIDMLVLTGQKNIEYFTDYRTLSWAYNARPLFALIDKIGLLVVASRIETRNLQSRSRSFEWVYYDGYLAEGASAVLAAIASRDPKGQCQIAIDYGQDMFGRGCVELVIGLQERDARRSLASGANTLWRTRAIKSRFEAELKRTSFAIVNAAFDRAVSEAKQGITEVELCRLVQAHIMENGADRADPIAMTFGQGDFMYNRLPGPRRLEVNDYVWTDFRSTYGGYPADRNRIARCGSPTQGEIRTYDATRSVTIELARSVKAGMECQQVFQLFQRLWNDAALPPSYGLVARIGHGGGLEVTEPPSISRNSTEVIWPGMILHLEPKLELDGAVFQFEEIIYVTDSGVDFLSELSPASIPVIAE